MIDIRHGDCLDVLPTLPESSVHCVVTSPPYWGLRDYGVEGQLGLERTPEEFVENMVGVFREVRRVLRPDGTLWLNMGDCYSTSPGFRPEHQSTSTLGPKRDGLSPENAAFIEKPVRPAVESLKPKDLVGQPWRLAFALQADGWWLRSDIIWAKPNPMPESVTDRPTKSHEYLFLLAKGQWSSRVVQLADLPDEVCHFSDNRRLESAHSWCRALCVRLASAIFDTAQLQRDLSLPALDAEVWKKGAEGSDSDFVRGLPMEHRAAVLAARLLASDSTTKEFLGELHRLWVTLPDRDQLLKAWVPAVLSDAPSVYRYRDGTVAIKDAGQVCKFDLVHGEAILSRPRGCSYYYDADAVREDAIHAGRVVTYGENAKNKTAGDGANDRRTLISRDIEVGAGRNLRDVWTIPTAPYPGAHFATFPRKLVEPCLKAGTSERGCCPECGAPWRRVVERERVRADGSPIDGTWHNEEKPSAVRGGEGGFQRTETTGWTPTCDCNNNCARCNGSGVTSNGYPDYEAEDCPDCEDGHHDHDPVPCTVMDPFFGSGTVGEVAQDMSLNCIGIELSEDYIALAKKRNEQGRLF